MIKGLKLSMKQMLMIVLIVCLIMPQAAMALEGGKFPDTSTHWANKHITKISLLGFAEGDVSGKYNPNNNITQQEVIIMLINMIGKKDQVNMESEANLSFEVAAWAKPYVVLALSEKLINMQEELSTQALNWGKKLATREWVTKLIVRAIGQQEQAELAQNDDTGFTDANLIGNGYAGYINIAQSLDIVNGYKDGTFNPVGHITRAEMAVLLGEAEQHLTVRSSMISSGIVLSLNENSIQIQESNGLVTTLSLHSSAGIYDKGSNDAISISNITVDDYVMIIHDQGVAYYVEISDEQIVMETFTGTMESISRVDLMITLNIEGASRSFIYANTVQVTNASRGLSVSDLTVGSTLELKRNTASTSADITQIIVKAAPVFKTVIGTVQDIQSITQAVDVRETSTGNTVSYPIPAGVVITSALRAYTGVSELYAGDEVTIELKDNVVTAFTVTKSSVIVKEGKVDSVDVERNRITLFADDGTTIGYPIIKGAQVIVTGLDGAGLSDVQENDEVIIEHSTDNLVSKIIVKNRSIEMKRGMAFFLYDESAKVIYLKKDPASKAEEFEVSSTTHFKVGETQVTLATLSTYFTKDKKVDITYSGNRLLSMTISTNYEGQLLAINATTKTIKLTSDSFGDLPLSYTNLPYVEVFGKPNASMSDLKIGDTVQVVLDANQDKVMQIKLVSTQLYKVLTKSNFKLTVKNESTVAADIFNTSMVPITHHTKLFATMADITDNMYIEATMVGTMPSAIHIPAVTMGKITAVNSGSGSITVEEYGKSAAKSITNAKSITVVKNSTTSTTLQSVAINDRAVVIEGKDGLLITVITPAKKSFIAYTAANKMVQLSVVLFTDPNQFMLADNAYIHKGSQVINVTSLSRNDQIMVYFLEGKIIEIEKL